MKLPKFEKAVVPKEKILNYLLSLTHRDGRGKAMFFMRFGYSQDKWEVLAQALKRHITQHEIARTEKSYFGMRYIIEGALESPDGRNPIIRSVWFVKNDGGAPFFVTAYPLKGKRND